MADHMTAEQLRAELERIALLVQGEVCIARDENGAAESRRAFERAEADVQALEREVERLRKIEQAAIAFLDRDGRDDGDMSSAYTSLAEACGREG